MSGTDLAVLGTDLPVPHVRAPLSLDKKWSDRLQILQAASDEEEEVICEAWVQKDQNFLVGYKNSVMAWGFVGVSRFDQND